MAARTIRIPRMRWPATGRCIRCCWRRYVPGRDTAETGWQPAPLAVSVILAVGHPPRFLVEWVGDRSFDAPQGNGDGSFIGGLAVRDFAGVGREQGSGVRVGVHLIAP